MNYFLELFVSGLTRGSIYALIALGYTMVYGLLELINFAHGEIYMLGAFTGLIAATVFAAAVLPPLGVLVLAAAAAVARDDALARFEAHQWAMTWKYGDMEASATRPLPPPAPPPLSDGARERLAGRAPVAGTAGQIVETLLDVRRRAGVPVEFAARSYFPTLDYGRQVALMTVLAEDVAPHI